MNNYQKEILQIFNSANSSIKVAVSWFTDEFLLESLIEKSKTRKVEVLLSSDELNLLRHNKFRELQSAGGKVRKIGSNDPIAGKFMHSKFIIIDNLQAFGGSYNFTINAKSNFENFKKYANKEVHALLGSFSLWWNNSIDFFSGVVSAEKVVDKLKKKFLESQQRNQTFVNKIGSQDFSSLNDEYVKVLETEKRKEELREVSSSILAREVGVSREGKISNSHKSIRSKNHRFYGGRFYSKYNGNKLPNSYSKALLQKKGIENNYDFLKCKILNDTLICEGEIDSNSHSKYKIRIEFRSGFVPCVFVLNPNIERDPEIHIYQEGNLCLYFPGDLKWKDTTSIAEYTVPWIFEWIYFYELWTLTGRWEGPEKKH